MGCIIKYKNKSIPEEQFLQYLNKQIAVNNLFEKDKTFANSVYEALGFKQDNVTNNTIKANIPQNLVSGIESFGTKQEANSEAKKLLGSSPHSIDMIEAGIRTRTTRSVGEMAKYNVKVGDIVKQFGKSADGTTKTILTRITAIHPKSSPEFLNTWEKEGWTSEGVEYIKRFKDGAAAIEFEVINNNQITQQQKAIAQQQILTRETEDKTILKINKTNYSVNHTTGIITVLSDNGNKTITDESIISKVYSAFAEINGFGRVEYNGNTYSKVFNTIINMETGKVITDNNINNLFTSDIKTEVSKAIEVDSDVKTSGIILKRKC